MAPPPPPNPTTPGAQYAQQFLSTALSQRGPHSLPYSEDAKWLIRHHLVSLTDAFPSLHPKSSSFTHNDGRTVNLLQAEGTIPIVFNSHLYNIPASIWLPEPYPRCPPSVFLTPTPNMVVKPGHPHVEPDGSVRVPYLLSWVYPSSNLVDLVRTLSHLFGLDPPLYTRQNPNPNPTPSPSPSPRPAPHPALSRPTEDPAEVFRRNAIAKIIESVHSDSAALRKNQEAEMEGCLSAQAALRQREDVLARGVRDMAEEKEGLEQQLQVMLMNSDVLENWLRENEGRRRNDVDVDDVFEPADELSRQMLDCTAADLAVDDTVYALDKAVQEGAVPFDAYLKSVRALSREQFFHRALAAKVRAAQVQTHVSGMAARVPQYGRQ